MYCKNCGKQIDDDAKFCVHCGSDVSQTISQEELQKQQAHEAWKKQMVQRLAGNNSAPAHSNPIVKKENTVFCTHCGTRIDTAATFCPACGGKVPGAERPIGTQPQPMTNVQASVAQTRQRPSGPCCPKCGSDNIDISIHQENTGGNSVTKTKSKYRQKGHGCLWWLLIGSWWWMVDLMLWICFFPIRFLFQLFKKKKYVGESTTVSSAKNHVHYKSVCLCKNCGYHWTK